jgi:hypothetical protein
MASSTSRLTKSNRSPNLVIPERFFVTCTCRAPVSLRRPRRIYRALGLKPGNWFCSELRQRGGESPLERSGFESGRPAGNDEFRENFPGISGPVFSFKSSVGLNQNRSFKKEIIRKSAETGSNQIEIGQNDHSVIDPDGKKDVLTGELVNSGEIVLLAGDRGMMRTVETHHSRRYIPFLVPAPSAETELTLPMEEDPVMQTVQINANNPACAYRDPHQNNHEQPLCADPFSHWHEGLDTVAAASF